MSDLINEKGAIFFAPFSFINKCLRFFCGLEDDLRFSDFGFQ